MVRSILDDLGEEVTGIVSPVSMCMALTVALVRILNPDGDAGHNTVAIATIYYHEQDDDSAGTKITGAIINAGIFVVFVGVLTFGLVLLYKYGYVNVIWAYMGFAGFLIFFVLTGVILTDLIQLLRFPIDYLSFVYMLYNFSVVGVLTLFFIPAPLLLKQGYLIITSITTAFIFTHVPAWTTWTLLIAMALYDLYAVLTPQGPLKMLLDVAQEREDTIPALIYEARAVRRPQRRRAHRSSGSNSGEELDSIPPGTVPPQTPRAIGQAAIPLPLPAPVPVPLPTMAGPSDARSPGVTQHDREGDESAHGDAGAAENGNGRRLEQKDNAQPAEASSSQAGTSSAQAKARPVVARQAEPSHEQHRISADEELLSASQRETQDTEQGDESAPLVPPGQELSHQQPHSNQHGQHSPGPPLGERQRRSRGEEDDEDAGLPDAIKLGLGDFIFYSVLVGRAAMYDLLTAIAAYLAIIAGWPLIASGMALQGGLPNGLGATLLLLAIRRQALPALPFSIALGVLFYFASRWALEPFLLPLSTQLLFF